MGQQQLLLLVLSTVIVGLATVAGIQAFDQGQTQANQQALQQTALKIASDIQAQAEKPSQLGGNDGSLTGGETLSSLGYDASSSASDLSGNGNDDGVYSTNDGECAISGSSPVGPSSGAAASASGSATTTVACASGENHVVVSLEGTDSGDITTNSVTTAS